MKREFNQLNIDDKKARLMLAIELKSISKIYPGVTALEHIDLMVKEKTVHGFLGPNGAGKSTTMNIITGLIPATTGDVFILGCDQKDDNSAHKNLIGHLPENPPLYLNMRVIDYLRFCQGIHESVNEKMLEDVIEKVGLGSVQNKMISHLSKGYKQRVGLAQTLVYGAKIIILDEPMVGLDPHAVRQMRDLIIHLKKDHTILLCTHQLDEAAKVCDEVTIIENGLVKKTGTIDELRNQLAGARVYYASLANPGPKLISILDSLDGVKASFIKEELKTNSDEMLINIEVTTNKDMRALLIKTLISHCDLYSFAPKRSSLEDIFKEVIKK